MDRQFGIRFSHRARAGLSKQRGNSRCRSRTLRWQITQTPVINTPFQVGEHARDVLIGHGTEYRIGIRMKTHIVEILGQGGGRVRIVGHVEDDGRTSRQDLKTAGQID